MPKTETPRCIIIRHGQTEWSKSGQYTGLTDLPLTPYGVKQMKATSNSLFLGNNFINPKNITYVFTSPRTRAIQTKDLILENVPEHLRSNIKVIIDNDLREWEYGDYEGLLTNQIVELRKSRGLDKERPWNIWRDGCENGESSKHIGCRLSHVIARIQNLHRKSLEKGENSDILVFAHGHTLRYFAALWFMKNVESIVYKDTTPPDFYSQIKFKEANGKDVTDELEIIKLPKFTYLVDNPMFLLDAGGVGVLSYSHHNIDEPALELAGPFKPAVDEESQHGDIK